MAENVPSKITSAIENSISERNAKINRIQSELDNVYVSIETCKAELAAMLENIESYDVPEIIAKREELEKLEKSKSALYELYNNANASKISLDHNALVALWAELKEYFYLKRIDTYDTIEKHLNAIISVCDAFENDYREIERCENKLKHLDNALAGVIGDISDYKKLKHYAKQLELYH